MTSDHRVALLAFLASSGCSSVKQEVGISVDVDLAGEGAPDALLDAWVGVRSVELVPCMMAWSPLDLLGAPARADHSIEAPTIVGYSGSTDLLGDAVRATLQPPPDSYCTVRAVLEPAGSGTDRDEATVGVALSSGVVSTNQVAWLDLPIDLTLSEDEPEAALTVSFDLSGWPDAAEQGPDALFATARDAVRIVRP